MKSLFDSFHFVEVPLLFSPERHRNVFATKNNKTLAETLDHPRYRKLSQQAETLYKEHLDQPLGTFLLSLKQAGDQFYRKFLNRYGDLEYSVFSIANQDFHALRGVYAYQANGVVQYIGRCRDSLKKRVDQGYGKIHPKNCYIDGQATNCHLNALITALETEITFWLHPMDNGDEIERFERQLIQAHQPPWNIQK